MKQTDICKCLLCLAIFSLSSSCNYEEINTDPTGMTTEEGLRDGFAMGEKIKTMQRAVVPVGTQANDTKIINTYQIAYHLSMDSWSGYFGQNNDWGGNSNPTYFLRDAWIAATYSSSYTDALSPWKILKGQAKETNAPEIFALAEILKISTWHKALESFGPIPYSHVEDPTLNIPFDSEREVYTQMFEDLTKAIAVLTPKAENGVRVMPDFDIIYGGDATRWVRYANSLLLRLSMRIRFADEALAKTYALKAIQHPIGVMTSKSDEAQISKGTGLIFRNNIYWTAYTYDETRMGSSMYSYLLGYKDPRLSAYFTPVGAQSDRGKLAYDGARYQAVPAGHRNGTNDVYKQFSKPKLEENSPTYWLRASEVYFLRAEAALIWGGSFGDASELYRQGVATSFQEHNINQSVDDYLSSGLVPIAHEIQGSFGGSFGTPKAVTPEFTGSTEEKLEKIITQKWIALYPNGTEAWTEWRRTGYPSLNPVVRNEGSSQGATVRGAVRRLLYPSSFQGTKESQAIYQDALKKLGGKDLTSTRLWWDCNPHISL